MKITKQQLRQIIIEERKKLLKEYGTSEWMLELNVSRALGQVNDLLSDLDPESAIAEQVLLAKNYLQQALELAGEGSPSLE